MFVPDATQPLHILIAIDFLSYRSGAELFVRDLAMGLRRRGHRVAVYAPQIGDIGDELSAAGIVCSTDLIQIHDAPDLIIGNTRRATVFALVRFADVPVLSICHDAAHRHGAPSQFTRIHRHVAVDANTRERLLASGLAEDRVCMIQNGVDMQRFAQRAAPLAWPRRAAIFSNYATAGAETAAIAAACAARGITLDVIGKESGNQAREPADVLPQYDLVFAKARCALEAMAVGCAVILANEGMGMGEMVHSSQLAQLRLWNFGRRLLRTPISSEAVGSQIDRYDARDAARVSDAIRASASLDTTVEAFVELARATLAQNLPVVPPAQEWRELAAFANEEQAHGLTVQDCVWLLQRLQASAEKNLAASVAQAQAAADEARAAAAAMRASLSWRLTAPLRALAAPLWRAMRRHAATTPEQDAG